MAIEVVVQMLMLNLISSYADINWDTGFVNFEALLREANPKTITGVTMGRSFVTNSRGHWGIDSS
jgi:hypothetical protein